MEPDLFGCWERGEGSSKVEWMAIHKHDKLFIKYSELPVTISLLIQVSQ